MLINPIEREECNLQSGIYRAKLINVGKHHNGIEDRFSFQYTITDGEYEGFAISKTTKTLWTPLSKLAQTVSGLLGQPLEADEFKREFDLNRIIGKQCCLWVTEETDKHGNTYPLIKEVMHQN